MGVKLKEILIRNPVSLEDLEGKTLVVDGNNMLYQFLSTIRSRDGQLLTNSKGEVTSHIIGLFSRVAKLMQHKIKLIFVFDGRVPELKHKELQKRKEAKLEAERKYEDALESDDAEAMKKYAARTSRLTFEMIAKAITLLSYLGIPCINAPSEGEAQAARVVQNGDAWAVVSQDYDSLNFGTPRLIQNLSIEGRRKVPGKFAYKKVEPLLIELEPNLEHLEITGEKLLWLSVLTGTDYAPAGVKGIGPKKGLKLVKETKSVDELFAQNPLSDDVDWKDVLALFKKMPVTDNYKAEWKSVNRKKVKEFLVEDNDFSEERVEKTLDSIAPAKNQSALGDFL